MRRLMIFLAAAWAVTMTAWPAVEFDLLADFARAGEQAVGGLVVHPDGALYGATAAGGAAGVGTIFRLSPAGGLSTLVSFSGNDGAAPTSELVVASDGSLYGVTIGGGSGGYGTVFRVTTAGVLTSLVSFTGTTGAAKGAAPRGLTAHADGFLYGVTQAGGAGGSGTVFKMSPTGGLTTLVEFTGSGGAARGAAPVGPLTVVGGVLYGVTSEGGAGGFGTVYRVTTAGVWTLLAEFTGTTGARPGAHPAGGLRLHPDGALYGTTEYGGINDFGTAFRVTTAASPTFSSLHSFADPTGSQPAGALGVDPAGALIGVTAAGGSGGLGTLYKLTTGGSHSVLVHFTGTSGGAPGATPRGGVTAGADGAFYGTTSAGGPGNQGVAFRMTAAGAFSRLAGFSPSLGWMPSGAPVVEASGSLLFPMAAGGSGGAGTLVRLAASGLPSLAAAFDQSTGGGPVGGLLPFGSSFVGVTSAEGASGRGTAFLYGPTTGVALLASFTSISGALAEGPLQHGSGGDVFGVSREGGLGGHGTVYKLTAAGVRTRIVSFTGTTGAARGRRPRGPLALIGTSYYGVTEQGGAANAGTLFRFTAAGVLSTLAEFTASGPRAPQSGLVPGGDGFLYGTTSLGGAAAGGTLFRLDPATGTWTVLAEFVPATGLTPVGPLLPHAGKLYGQTATGGSQGVGTIFQYAPGDGLTAVVSFTGPSGSAPGAGRATDGTGSSLSGGLVAGPDGHLYGVAAGGGSGGGGTAFRLRLNPSSSPFEAWKSAELGDPTVSDAADPDADGLPVLLEYALHLQPDHPDVADLPAAALKSYTDGSRLHMILTRDPQRSDITLLVQAANDLAGPWETMATSLAGAPFSGPGYVAGDAATPGLKSVEIRDTQPLSGALRRFMRLKISH